MKNSVYSLLQSIIKDLGVEKEFIFTKDSIKHKNGSEFIFKGLKKESVSGILSIQDIKICWVEEAQYVSEESLKLLLPSIRADNSVIIFTMNPRMPGDAVYKQFVLPDRDDTVKVKVNYYDNPFFPKVLKDLMEYDKKNNYNMYLHTWEGMPVENLEGLVFDGRFETTDCSDIDFDEYFYGLDFGSTHPTSMIKMGIID